jgi:DegV family protein with EDD domain
VVDADTGTNMSQTLTAAVRAIEREAVDLPREVLLGARGNSGVILAQFLVGFLDRIGPDDPADRQLIVNALSHGRKLAYQAVSEPVEGTILTAMTDLARLVTELDGVPDFERHRQLERRMAASVAATPTLMPRLAEAGVVDSGALGFHVFAGGLTLILPGLNDATRVRERIEARLSGADSAPLGEIAEQIDPAFLEAAASGGASERYCVDLVVELAGAPPAGWQSHFEALGGSVDVVRRDDLLKLHLHCDEPQAAIDAAQQLGRVIDTTTQDLAAELRRVASGIDDESLEIAEAGRFRVLGDSSMSLDRGLAHELGVAKIQNYVNVFGETIRDDDLDRETLFARMRDGASFKTAQTSAEDVRSFLDRVLEGERDALYLAVGRAYTGTQDLVRRVAAEHPLGERLTVLDTRAASGQQGLVTLAVARRATEVRDLDELLAYAAEQIRGCREYLVIDDLKYLVNSGRVGRVKAAFAGVLSLKPIVGHGGEGAITWAKVRSHRAGLAEITRRVATHPGEGPLLLMVEHTDNRDWALAVCDALAQALPADCEIVLAPLSSTSAVHMGPGTWGVAVTRL